MAKKKKKKKKAQQAKNKTHNAFTPNLVSAQVEATSNSPPPKLPKQPRVVKDWANYLGQGSLEDWQRLMRDLGFTEDFPSKTQCRKMLKTVWVNIYDFLSAVKRGEPVTFFDSRTALARYTVKKRKFYPKNSIEKDSPLRELLAPLSFNRRAAA
ncbi:hypothetical protein F5Y16DRAFT_393819 [Xylariaceae sp. FL0255]|nr:hypothetical protein F5Y16DRAFT_393819 [Xylariaceae sp. FL0255]